MIVVHHLENSRSQRVLWLLEELGLAYEVKRYRRDPKTMLAPPELSAVHPLGKSPVITDGDATLAETGAIVEHLVETYGGGRLIPPAGSAERREYRYWLHHAEGTAMPPLLMKLVFAAIPKGAPAPVRPVAAMIAKRATERFADPRIAQHLRFWENRLAQSEWFAGPEFTAADIMMSFPLEVAGARAGVGEFTYVRAFLDRIHEREAYRRALERGGPYSIIG